MERIAPGRDLLERYDRSGAHDFAIIRSVAEGVQDGVALASGEWTCITHASGFTQLLGQVASVEEADGLLKAWRAHPAIAGRYVMVYDVAGALRRPLSDKPQLISAVASVRFSVDGKRTKPCVCRPSQARKSHR